MTCRLADSLTVHSRACAKVRNPAHGAVSNALVNPS